MNIPQIFKLLPDAAVEGDGRASQPKIIIVKVEAEELITVKLADNFGQTLLWTLPVQPRARPYDGLSAKEIRAVPSARKSRGSQRKASPQFSWV